MSESDATNESGCANFYYVPVGNYTVTVAASGLVDRSGRRLPEPSPPASSAAQSTLTTIELDVPVTVNVNFDTKQGTAAAVAAPSQYARLASSGLASPGYSTEPRGTFPSTHNTFSSPRCSRSPRGFAVYGGNCDSEQPGPVAPTYTGEHLSVAPGGDLHASPRACPALWIRVQRNGVNLPAPTSGSPRRPPAARRRPSPSSRRTAAGALPKPGYPWGTYSVCADDSVSNAGTVRKVTVTMNNTTSVTGGGTAQTTHQHHHHRRDDGELLMRDERGMTLVELIVAMTIGLIVIAAALTATTRAFEVQKEAADRTNATQRGRIALETMTRALRSQVCMGTPRTAIKAADNNSVSFTADLSGGATLPDKYTLTYDPTAKTITEYVYDGSGTYPTLIFPATPDAHPRPDDQRRRLRGTHADLQLLGPRASAERREHPAHARCPSATPTCRGWRAWPSTTPRAPTASRATTSARRRSTTTSTSAARTR